MTLDIEREDKSIPESPVKPEPDEGLTPDTTQQAQGRETGLMKLSVSLRRIKPVFLKTGKVRELNQFSRKL
ncbi:MAG: hypothetical protein GY795_19550 [Desulfobacterales bacterium]|nr:hypothetical protein [Desulfobacterales bacterium]